MTPFYFGDRRRRLFGSSSQLASRAWVRAQRCCATLGRRICPRAPSDAAACGPAVSCRDRYSAIRLLRHGDSAGEMVEADLAGWETDIELAIEELRDMVGSARVTLIGLRLGATLAARVAARRPGDVDTLVLWDPIQSGMDYLMSLGAATAPSASVPRGGPRISADRRDASRSSRDRACASACSALRTRTDPGHRPRQPPGDRGRAAWRQP